MEWRHSRQIFCFSRIFRIKFSELTSDKAESSLKDLGENNSGVSDDYWKDLTFSMSENFQNYFFPVKWNCCTINWGLPLSEEPPCLLSVKIEKCRVIKILFKKGTTNIHAYVCIKIFKEIIMIITLIKKYVWTFRLIIIQRRGLRGLSTISEKKSYIFLRKSA